MSSNEVEWNVDSFIIFGYCFLPQFLELCRLIYSSITHFDQNLALSKLSKMTTPLEQQVGASDFKIKWEPTVKTKETLCWTQQQAKNEIHVVLLEKVELSDILPHCLGVLHKINRQVGLDIEERRIASYLQVLPRTMLMALLSYWKQVLQEYDELYANPITNLDEFNLVLKTFFAGHSTEDDCHDLLESL
jgi:hypothetical protein